MRIAFLTDLHLAQGSGERALEHREHVTQVLADLQGQQPDLILVAGDLTEAGTQSEFAEFMEMGKASAVPVWAVPGNHDVGNKAFEGATGTVTTQRLVAYEDRVGPSFFAQSSQGLRVIGINGSLFGSELPQEKEQWDLLEQEFSQDSALPRLLLTHYPLYLSDPSEPGGDYWTMEPQPRQRLLQLIRGKVIAVFSGHLHRPIQFVHENILFLTGRPSSFGLPRGVEPVGWFMVTLDAMGEIKVEERVVG